MTEAITPSQFDTLMQKIRPWKTKPSLAVAVSGGADSMALALLAHEWAIEHGGKIVALTVDHGLRKASSKEAQQVKKWLSKYSLPLHILKWQGKKPASNIQATAREARYQLMTDWCKTHGVKYLLLAHHLDDQAETVLMRLARGSGVDGLAAMPLSYSLHGISLLRPLLSIPKEQLEAYLNKQPQKWITDPSNRNPAYDRARLREALGSITDYKLLRQRLADTAAHMARARHTLETQTEQALRAVAQLEEGKARLNIEAWRKLDEEIALRILAKLTRHVDGTPYKPRFDSLTLLYQEMLLPSFTATRSFGGCLWTPSRKKGQSHLVEITRENVNIRGRQAMKNKRYSH